MKCKPTIVILGSFFSVGVLTSCSDDMANLQPNPSNTVSTDRIAQIPLSDREQLGSVLFYDAGLSVNGTVSCSNCHTQGSRFTADHAIPSIAAHGEMGLNDPVAFVEHVRNLSYYDEMFQKQWTDGEITMERITSSVASYMNALNKLSEHGRTALSQLQEQGRELFMEKYNCESCHHLDGSPQRGINPALSGYEMNLHQDRFSYTKQEKEALVAYLNTLPVSSY